jgi:hypothetical protein
MAESVERQSRVAKTGSWVVRRFTADFEAGMAAAILAMAVYDWREPAACWEEVAKRLGFNSLEEEVAAFWDSQWGMNLREWFGLEDLDIEEIPGERSK